MLEYTRGNPLKYNDPTGHDVGCSGVDCSVYIQPEASEKQLQVAVTMPVVRPVSTPPTPPVVTPTPVQTHPAPLTLLDSESQSFDIYYLDVDEFGIAVDVLGILGDLSLLVPADGGLFYYATEAAEFYTVLQDVDETVSHAKFWLEGDDLTKDGLFALIGLGLDIVSLFPSWGVYANGADIYKELLQSPRRETFYVYPDQIPPVTKITPLPQRVPEPY